MNDASLIQKRLGLVDDLTTPLYFIACDVIGFGSMDAIPGYVFEYMEGVAEIGDVLL